MPTKVEARMRMWAVIFLGVYLCTMTYFKLAPEPNRISKITQTHTTHTKSGVPVAKNRTVTEYRGEAK